MDRCVSRSMVISSYMKVPQMNDTKKYYIFDPLSERELEILRLIEGCCTNREIAKKLVLSLETIK